VIEASNFVLPFGGENVSELLLYLLKNFNLDVRQKIPNRQKTLSDDFVYRRAFSSTKTPTFAKACKI
jgi:hypothetical protein